MKKYVILGLVTLAAVGIICAAPVIWKEPVEEVEVIRMRQEEYAASYLVNGVVEAPYDRTLSPSYPFVPAKVLVESGDFVEYGQVIAVIDPEETVRALSRAAKQYVDFLPEMPAGSEMDQLIKELEAGVSEAQFPLEVRAPMRGTLTAVELREGELYLPGVPAAIVSDLRNLQVRLAIPEEKAGRLQSGQPLLFQTPAIEDGFFSAHIKIVHSSAVRRLNGTNYQTIVEAVARVDDAFEVLRPGYSVRAEIEESEPETLNLLPYEAVLRDEQGENYVYVVQEGWAKKRIVHTGKTLPTAVEIVDGLGRYENVVWDAGALDGECRVEIAAESGAE